MNDIPDLPVVPLPGAEGWQGAYELGNALAQRFPEQDADQFAHAVANNAAGPTDKHGIAELVMVRQGERDEASWMWHVTFDDGSRWVAEGGCDYTGWDCQSWLTWQEA